MKVLIVDDEQDIANILKEVIEDDFKAEIDIALDGLEAYELTKKNKYDLICTDHKMPFMTGIEMVRAIREKDDNPNKATPVLCITAYVPQIKENFDAGGLAVKFMDKPIDFDELIANVKAAIN